MDSLPRQKRPTSTTNMPTNVRQKMSTFVRQQVPTIVRQKVRRICDRRASSILENGPQKSRSKSKHLSEIYVFYEPRNTATDRPIIDPCVGNF